MSGKIVKIDFKLPMIVKDTKLPMNGKKIVILLALVVQR
jgi:hypothetical protein